MKRFLTYIKYELKIFLGSYRNMFWLMAFPILLLSVFSVAFSSLRFEEINIDKSEIAYHEDAFFPLYLIEMTKNPDLLAISYVDNTKIENSIFNGKLMNEKEALKELEEDKIDAYVNKDLELVVNKNGINQMIMDEVLTMYKQIEKLDLPINAYEFNRNYVAEVENKHSPIDVIFYSLFSMISLYGAYLGSSIGNRLIVRGNKVSLRNATSSTPMSWQILVSVLSCFLWSVLMLILMLIHSELILKQNFFATDINNIPLLMSGIIFGISWGLFLGTFIARETTQIAAVIGTLLFMSGISGLFSSDLRIQIQRVMPIIGNLNPISILSSELIKINMLSNYTTLLKSITILIVYSIILISVSTIYIRRKRV